MERATSRLQSITESEEGYAIRLAHAVLDKADQFGAIDPDGDLAVLARQFLRAKGLI